MKSIFTLILGLFLAISSFSQSESLLASVEIISAPEVEMEKDTTFVISECDSVIFSESIDDSYSWLGIKEHSWSTPVLFINDSIYLPVIHKITRTEKFDFSVSDIDRTPDSVKEFVESVNDSTIFLAETNDGKFFSVNSFQGFDDQYEKIIVADTIKINDEVFVFDSTQMAIIKKFIHDNYIVGSTDTVARMISFVSGYTEDEELAMLERHIQREVVQVEQTLKTLTVSTFEKQDSKNRIDFWIESLSDVVNEFLLMFETPNEEAQVYFASYSSPVERIVAKQPVNKSASAVEEGEEYSSFEIFFIIFLCVAFAVFLLLPIVTIAFGKKILPYLSHSEKRLVVKWEVSFMRHLRKKRKPPYYTEPAEEGARVSSS